ncbi:hypothetical protein, variant [Puccinia triticina 1-1 BBBD Race 1]|uniref:Uncharacterized protein n=1 Tax=Puccinia triticina (isolate 1-1 / race 1 (BBBD)) TaxID=630390 RepID=A0A180GWU6_PUCT1|nr:hypothetical protein PTTG_26118 [Puccinia triticina 1-1 BBBD Race 1]OAV97297.1 hypothetical protein, variant [Puccinia triticina 1-1 BBBD Race 1]WAR63566.1 hypothetical protein PtB15_17B166 [Puccinia triticina]
MVSDTLSTEEIVQCTRKAQIDGTLAGIASGLATTAICTRFIKLQPKIYSLIGLSSGILVAYYYSTAALEKNLKTKEYHKRMLISSELEAFKDELPLKN